MHKLLARQIRRHFGSDGAVPETLRPLIELVDAAYQQADVDRAQLEHSLETLSEELVERYSDLRGEQARYRILAEERSLGPIFDRAGVGLVVVSPAGEILHTNPAFDRFLGYSERELIGRATESLSPDEEAAAVRTAMADLVAGRIQSSQLDRRYLHKGGATRIGRLSLSLVRSDAGDPLYVMGLVEDVTERIRIQDALRESEEQLRQAQKMDAVGRLAGGVAHDFNNLLTAILGPVDLARNHLDPDHPVLEDLEDIRAATLRATELTKQLLAFGRQQVLTAELLDPNEVVEETVRLLRRVLGAHIQLVVALAKPLGGVMADRTQLHQVVMNLALNARDAMAAGGTLTIETKEVEIDPVSAERRANVRPGRYVQLCVSDTGLGMDRHTREHLFEPFFTTKERDKGTGLGLTTVHGIVTQAGGHVRVYSEVGLGSTFKIYLPWVGGAPTAPRAARTARGGSETILLVEDDDVVLRVAVRTLVRAGYRVISAVNGRDALEKLGKHRWEIALVATDVVMPVMSGSELAARMVDVAPEIPMLFLSGYADEAIVRQGGIKPGSPFLQKPFTVDGLVTKVREVLDAPRAQIPAP